jgi:thymidylate synthase (FAD)
MTYIPESVQVVPQSVDYLGNSFEDPFLMVERAARLCYKSESKLGNTANLSFLKGKLFANQHFSPLEHVQITFSFSKKNLNSFVDFLIESQLYPYIKLENNANDSSVILTINFRTIMDMCRYLSPIVHDPAIDAFIYFSKFDGIPLYILSWVNCLYPSFFELQDYISSEFVTHNMVVFYNDYNKYRKRKKDEESPNFLSVLREEVPSSHKRHVFRIVTDRAIANEIVRHRTCSFTQESTRYCDYGKSELITICIPRPEYSGIDGSCYLNNDKDEQVSAYAAYVNSLAYVSSYSYNEYKALKRYGFTSQYARGVLPLCLKTELIVSGMDSGMHEISSGLRNFVKFRKDLPGYHPFCLQISTAIDTFLAENA